MNELERLQPLIGGNVLGVAWFGIKNRIACVFPSGLYPVKAIPARASQPVWTEVLRRTPMIGIGWRGWEPSRENGRVFRGTLLFGVFGIVESTNVETLIAGSSLKPGMLGMSVLLAAALHGHTIAGVGTCKVRQLSGETPSWVRDNTATAALEVAIENVAIDLSDVAASLDDFLVLANTWETASLDEPEPSILNVRDPQ